MSSPDFNGLEATQHSKDFFITYSFTLTSSCFVHSCYLLILKTVSFGHYYIFWTTFNALDFILHIFLTLFFGLYTILNELWQLQIYDEQFQQPGAPKVLTKIPPLLDEFIIEVREQLTIFPSPEQTPSIQEIQQECCES